MMDRRVRREAVGTDDTTVSHGGVTNRLLLAFLSPLVPGCGSDAILPCAQPRRTAEKQRSTSDGADENLAKRSRATLHKPWSSLLSRAVGLPQSVSGSACMARTIEGLVTLIAD